MSENGEYANQGLHRNRTSRFLKISIAVFSPRFRRSINGLQEKEHIVREFFPLGGEISLCKGAPNCMMGKEQILVLLAYDWMIAVRGGSPDALNSGKNSLA